MKFNSSELNSKYLFYAKVASFLSDHKEPVPVESLPNKSIMDLSLPVAALLEVITPEKDPENNPENKKVTYYKNFAEFSKPIDKGEQSIINMYSYPNTLLLR